MEEKFEFFASDFVPEQDASEEDFVLDENGEKVLKVRLDKWLWAARFFKTRALARAAVENGKVYYNSERSKPSREIEIGATLQIRHGRFNKVVIIKGLSTRRRNTEEALQLFEEIESTEEGGGGTFEAGYGMFRNPYRPIRDSYQQGSQQQEFDQVCFTQKENQQERRSVRFLRRSFVKNEQDNQDQRVQREPRDQRDYSRDQRDMQPNFQGDQQRSMNHTNNMNNRSGVFRTRPKTYHNPNPNSNSNPQGNYPQRSYGYNPNGNNGGNTNTRYPNSNRRSEPRNPSNNYGNHYGNSQGNSYGNNYGKDHSQTQNYYGYPQNNHQSPHQANRGNVPRITTVPRKKIPPPEFEVCD